MEPLILDGKKASEHFISQMAKEVLAQEARGLRKPHLAAVLVGDNGASQTYVQAKVKACKRAGFASTLLHLEASISEEALLEKIHFINADESIDGLIVQLPLPAHIQAEKITEAIHPAKDVDGFHPINLGKLALGQDGFVPATPLGITMLLEYYQIQTAGKHAVVLGRSHIVGAPMAVLLSSNQSYGNCTVSLCHSRTKDLASFTRQADIIVAAIGKPEYLSANMVKHGAVVIDVGITRIADANQSRGYRIAGDVVFEELKPVCSAITPVPGGVGPMTIAALLQNTLKSWNQRLIQ